MLLKTKAVMEKDAAAEWNPKDKLPYHQWLVSERSVEDEARLCCLGNVVMPRCGQTACHLIEHSLRER